MTAHMAVYPVLSIYLYHGLSFIAIFRLSKPAPLSTLL
uniref:Uncharacterized protein n=1 Tax=Anguilla anguilla TaxID=7936 RepID=A0A0E9RWZ3_ANGAN